MSYFDDLMSAVGGYLRNVASGQVASQGLNSYFGQNTYDPNRSFAQNALDPRALGTATNLAMSFSGGGMKTKPTPADAGAPYPQYAESYPPVGEPVPAIDKKTGNPYLAKQLTPEAVDFQKTRAGIMNDMAANGYEPYFDPTQRFHVDPSNYPPNVDTSTITPAKQTTIDKDMVTIGSPQARANLQSAYATGSAMPNTNDWYALGQVEKAFTDALGPQAGRKAFQDRIATSMAATTGGADPTSNFLMSQYGNYLRSNNLPYPTAAYEMPFPIGGRYASGNMAMHQKIMDQGGFDALGAGNPKRHDFAQNFTGNPNVGTIDEQMTSGMTPGVNMPPPGKYGLYQQVLGQEAQKAGVPPQNFQDVAWAGFKNQKDPTYTAGQPMISVINDSIERTHRLTGMPRSEIVRRGLIGGSIPMYGLAGYGLMGGGSPGGYFQPPSTGQALQ